MTTEQWVELAEQAILMSISCIYQEWFLLHNISLCLTLLKNRSTKDNDGCDYSIMHGLM